MNTTVTTDGAQTTETGTGRRGSTVLLAAGVIVGTALVLWGLDRLARWGAEALLARDIQINTGVTERPDVHLHGLFFLPQVIQGRYDDVEITLHGLRSAPLEIDRVHAELRGVHLTFHDVLTQDVGAVYVERTQEVATLSYADINAYLDSTGRQVRIDGAPAGEVQLTGSVEVLGREFSASALADIEIHDGDLVVTPSQLDTGTVIDQPSRLLLRQRFTFVVPMDPLPFGQALTELHLDEDGMTVDVRGSGVLVRP